MGLTVNVDITDFLRKVKEREVDFFLSFCWCVYRAANAVPEFRQRIKDGRIVEYPEALMSTTLSMPDGNYCYCDFDCKLPFDEYLPKAREAKRLAIERGKIEEYADVDASEWYAPYIATAKANGLNTYQYLELLLTELPNHTQDKSLAFLDELLPW